MIFVAVKKRAEEGKTPAGDETRTLELEGVLAGRALLLILLFVHFHVIVLQYIAGSTNVAVQMDRSGRLSMAESHKKRIAKKGGLEVVKKLLKMIPIIGPVFSVGFAGHDIKKKGLVPGAFHVGLDVTPVVGTAKNILEIFTGDIIPDKPPKTQPLQEVSQPKEPTQFQNQNQKNSSTEEALNQPAGASPPS